VKAAALRDVDRVRRLALQDLGPAQVLARIREARVPDPRELAPECPPALASVLMEALAPNPSRRPRSAAAFRDALAASIA
jgi:serine/threonine protein kinase